MTRETTPRRPRHVFIAGPYRDHRMRPLCGQNDCGQLADAAVHHLPDNPGAELDARVLGEREDPT